MHRALRDFDTFADCIYLNDHRAIIVHHRLYGKWEFVRFRHWNRHLVYDCWYPGKRDFIVAANYAPALANAIHAAADCQEGNKPAWFVEHEEQNPRPLKGKAAKRLAEHER